MGFCYFSNSVYLLPIICHEPLVDLGSPTTWNCLTRSEAFFIPKLYNNYKADSRRAQTTWHQVIVLDYSSLTKVGLHDRRIVHDFIKLCWTRVQ